MEKTIKEKSKAVKNSSGPKTMQEAMETMGTTLVPLKVGEMVDVTVLAVKKNKILVDVAGLTPGFIPEKEFSSDVLDLKVGDKIPALVIMLENDEKQTVLSLKRASKERYWQKLNESIDKGEVIKVRVKEANRGGLMVEYGNIEGFLPVSHLSSEHYPKVGNQKEKILARLKLLINKSLTVKVINLEQGSSKVIFSEKEAGDKSLEEKIKRLKIGEKFLGKVTGIVDFGIFVSFSPANGENEIEGLAHISELSWNRVDDIRKLYKVGDKVQVEVIDLKNNKVFLSVKRLLVDPWLELVKKYKVGDKVQGKVIKITPYGAFVNIENKITGMFHISELAVIGAKKTEKIEDLLDLGKEYEFAINSIDAQAHKIGLSWPVAKTKKPDNKETKKQKKEKTKIQKNKKVSEPKNNAKTPKKKKSNAKRAK